MKLDEYLNLNNLSLRSFARLSRLGVATVLRARDGTGIVSRRTLQAIFETTKGQVGVVDLIHLDGDGDKEDYS